MFSVLSSVLCSSDPRRIEIRKQQQNKFPHLWRKYFKETQEQAEKSGKEKLDNFLLSSRWLPVNKKTKKKKEIKGETFQLNELFLIYFMVLYS